MSRTIPEPDLNYLQKVLLEMLAIPSPTGLPTPSCATSPSAWKNSASPLK